jgi:lysozyme
MIDNIFDQLVRDEGTRYTAYQDSRGVWTLGIGHNLSVPISHDAARQILRDDVLAADTSCRQLPIWRELSEARQGVLVNMAFNLGFAGLMQFRGMYQALEAADYPAAAREMLASRWATQVGARAERLAKQMTEDVWV